MKAQKANPTRTIGRLAEETGVHFETIRYYQRLGLMPTPARPRGSVRRYGEDSVSRLHSSSARRGWAFPLEEVRLLLAPSVVEHCAETRSLAEQKMQIVKKKISDLRGIQTALDRLIHACGTGGKGRGCPIIESLSAERRSKRGNFQTR